MQQKKQKASSLDIIEQLEVILSTPISRREVLEQLCREFNCKERLMEDRLREIIDATAVLRNNEYKESNFSPGNMFDVILIDEAHEHNTYMDMILTLSKFAIYINNQVIFN